MVPALTSKASRSHFLHELFLRSALPDASWDPFTRAEPHSFACSLLWEAVPTLLEKHRTWGKVED